ncbi:MAG: hypothetical protein IIW27_03740 [Clostridia bacterium]|jgi:hypothetical protein|nr:hypothetical protein [Clostridia bacterium]
MKRHLGLIASVCALFAALIMYLLAEGNVIQLGGRHNAYWFFIFAAFGLGVVLLIQSLATVNKNNLMLLAFASFALGAVLTACNYKVSNVLTVVLCIVVFGYALLAVAIILSAKKQPQTKNAQPDYKSYAERKAEEAQLPKEEKPLPEIKSFEDVNKKGEWRE